MSFDVFGLAIVVSKNSCQDNTKMACNLDPRSIWSVKCTGVDIDYPIPHNSLTIN